MASCNAAIWAAFLLLVVFLRVEAAIVQQTRQSSLRYQRIGTTPEQADPGEREAPTREDLLQQQTAAQVASMPPASMPALQQQIPLAQLQQMQQQQQQQIQQWEQLQQLQHAQEMQQQGAQPQNVAGMSYPVPVQAQQVMQAQALQLQQMQQQLQKQQQELLRLQQQQQVPHAQQAPKQDLSRQHLQQHPQPASRPHSEQQRVQQTQALVGVGTKVSTKESAETGTGAIARPKGWDQCLKFARYVKSQDVTGMELVRVWKSTCEPAVESGRATERYKLMCNSLTGVVQPYSAQIDYDVEQLCDAVLAVFHDITAVDVRAR